MFYHDGIHAQRRHGHNCRGSVLTLSLFVALLILTIAAGVLSLTVHSQTFSARAAQHISARAAADAGMACALVTMNSKTGPCTWSDGALPHATKLSLPNTEATFSYSVSGSEAAGYAIASTGSVTPLSHTVTATLLVKGVFDMAILVGDKLTMGNNTVVDGFNSADPLDTTRDVTVATLSADMESITLGKTVVNADVFVGVGGDVDKVISGGTINGETAALTEPIILDPVSAPVLPDLGVLNVTVDRTISPAHNGQYDSITISNSKTLTIDGGDVVVHCTGDLKMENGTQITIKSGSTLTLYIGGNIDTGNSNGIGNENPGPSAFKLVSTTTAPRNYVLKNNTSIFGIIYAPNANIELQNNGDICGAVVANSFAMKNNGTFLYDEALQNAVATDPGAKFVIHYWSE